MTNLGRIKENNDVLSLLYQMALTLSKQNQIKVSCSREGGQAPTNSHNREMLFFPLAVIMFPPNVIKNGYKHVIQYDLVDYFLKQNS